MVVVNTYDSWVNNVKAISVVSKIISDVFWCSSFAVVMSLVLVAMAYIAMTHSHKAREVIFLLLCNLQVSLTNAFDNGRHFWWG
jgi:hypothetical protein